MTAAASGGLLVAGEQAWARFAVELSRPPRSLVAEAVAFGTPVALVVATRVQERSLRAQLWLAVAPSLAAAAAALMTLVGTPDIWITLGLSLTPLVHAATDRLEVRLFGEVTPGSSAP